VADATIWYAARATAAFTTLDGRRHARFRHVRHRRPQRAIRAGRGDGRPQQRCTESTTRVLLESAYFDPVATPATSEPRLKTDAAYRFERGPT